MLSRIFPAAIDGTYRGHRLGLWLFGFLVIMKLVMSTNSIVNARSVAIGGDGFPLQSYGTAAAQAVVMLFALVGLGQLALTLLSIVALIRYRAMIPLMYLLLLLEQILRRAVVQGYAIERAPGASAGAYVNLALLTLLVGGFALTLARTQSPAPAAL